MKHLLLLLSVLASPASAQEVAAATPSEPAARADALHSRRDDPAVEKELESLLRGALQISPDDYGLLWRMARLRHWQADGLKGEPMARLGREAWEWGDKAIKVNPAGVEGHYYAGIGLGAYSQGAGILRALTEGLEGKFNARVDKSMQIGASFDRAGPLLTKGRYHFELPWPKRDLGKSAALLRQVIDKFPGRIRGGVYLAETLLADGNAAEAKQVLETALAQPPSGDPPEDRRALAWGKALQPKIQAALK
jgi:hypothetical protein